MRASGLRSTGPNFAKSTFGQGSRSMPPTPPPLAAAALRLCAGAAPPFANASTSSCRMRPWLPLPLTLPRSTPQLARELAHGRAGIGERESRFVDARRPPPLAAAVRRRRTLRRPARGSGCTAVHGRCRDRRWRATGSTEPSLTLSPTLTLIVAHGARQRRRHVHRRLVRLERDQRILGLHGVAGLDEDLDDRHVLEVADVGNAHLGDAGRRADRRGRRRR